MAAASSAAAPQLLDDRQMAHSALKFSIFVYIYSTCNIDTSSIQADYIRISTVIIWNEILINNHHNFESVDCEMLDIS